MSFPEDTIAALATPAGTSAIALIRASGPAVARLAGDLWNETPASRQARHRDYRRADGSLIDDVVCVYFPGPSSYTGEDILEITCHGNPLIAQAILEDLCRRGCRLAEAGEFTKRAFLNGRMDLSQAEAVMDLIQARSERALATANQLLRGALTRKMDDLTRQLVEILARIEAYIDFPEEDLPAEDQAYLLSIMERLLVELRRLIATEQYGTMLRDGIRTVILGQPNAGKSSLLNRLVGRERALVSAEPGTTRDYLEERVQLGSQCLRLIDTAGLNSSASGVELGGVRKSLEQLATADLFLWVIDSTAALPDLPEEVRVRMHPDNAIAVMNKSDLPGAGLSKRPNGLSAISVSALRGDGIELLQTEIERLVVGFGGSIAEDLVAINARHALSLEAAKKSLESGLELLKSGKPSELIASELRFALDSFGQVAGRVDNERILDQLFATFCIGK